MKVYLQSALLLAAACSAGMASDPIPSSYLPYGGTWEGIVGVSNGIPARATVFTNFTSADSLAKITNGIAVCPSNQVVQLAAGTYSFAAGDLVVNNNGVTVQGATNSSGIPTTVLVLASACSVQLNTTSWDTDAPADYSNINISSGLTRGSTSIVVASTPTGLTAGTLLWISAPRNAPTIDGNPSAYFANWFGSTDNHPFSEVFKVTGVAGTTINFWPALNSDYLTNGTIKVHFRTFAKQLVLCGLENLILTNTTGFFNCSAVYMSGCDQCWLKNCYIYGVGQNCQPNAGIKFYTSFNCEVRHCRVENAADFGASEYGLILQHCSGLLVEDNVFTTLPNVFPYVAGSRCAYAFNIFTNEPYQAPTFLSQIVFHHGAHDHYNLFEGNWNPTHYNDETSLGNFSHSRNSVYFRQRMLGWDGNGPKSVNINCISLMNHHDNVAIAGCVMGRTNTQSTVINTNSGSGSGGDYIYNADATSWASLVRKANYNTVDAAINPGETLGGGEALATSYLHSSKPAWFGNLPWPWCDPSNYTQSNAATNLPSGYRFALSADPPVGGGGGNTTNSVAISGGVTLSGTIKVAQ